MHPRIWLLTKFRKCRRIGQGIQCCQMVFVEMRKKMAKMREKMRQPKMSKILLHFWTFQRGYKNQSSKIILKIAKNKLFYVVKFDNVQNAPFFGFFAQCAKALSKCARGGARCAIFAQLRKIWQHWSSVGVRQRIEMDSKSLFSFETGWRHFLLFGRKN